MKKYILVLICVLAWSPLYQSCGIFSNPDPTSAIIAVGRLDRSFEDVLDSFREVISNSDLTPAKKVEILSKIDTVSKNRAETVSALVDYLQSVGDLNWKAFSTELLSDLKELRRQYKEVR